MFLQVDTTDGNYIQMKEIMTMMTIYSLKKYLIKVEVNMDGELYK